VRRRTGAALGSLDLRGSRRVTLLIPAIGICFGALGAAAERLASVWPPDEARRRPPGVRTAALAAAAGLAAAGIVARSQLPAWATAAYLAMLAVMVLLVATDLEQRRLPHLLLDPLIVLGLAFVPFNPATPPLSAIAGALAAAAFLGVLGLVVRGGVALGDLYLVAPIGLLLGVPGVFVAIFTAAFLSAGVSLALLASKRVGMKSYIPFGPFLVGGAVLALIFDPVLLVAAAAR
jgi:leader peptidase (prepilin peptidase) / N-methyltransferase